MRRNRNLLSLILTISLAIILLFSGFAKAADAAYFSNLIFSTFHLPWLSLLSPVLILLEVALGSLLLVGWRPRLIAAATGIMILGVTIIYLLGVILFGMTSCGCFGHLSFLNFGLAGTLIRNFLLLSICLYLILSPVACRLSPVAYILSPLAITIAAFMAGYTLPGAMVFFSRSQHWQQTIVEASPLRSLSLSSDSTYLVYLFSFNCPFCQMAVGNVALYEPSHTVDRVVAIAADDPEAEQVFRRTYTSAPFPYRTLPMDSLNRLVPELPTAFFVVHDTIRYVWTGEVPPPLFIR